MNKTPTEPLIDRRDFINGVAATALASQFALAPSTATANDNPLPQNASLDPADYPPVATGLRGQYPGSFEVAHTVRDGQFAGAIDAEDTGETYDLIIVGGGISGLSAAHFFRKAFSEANGFSFWTTMTTLAATPNATNFTTRAACIWDTAAP